MCTRRSRLRYGVRALGLATLLILAYVNMPADWGAETLAEITLPGKELVEYLSGSYLGPPVDPTDLATCFDLIVSQRESVTRGDAAAVISLAALTVMAEREKLSVKEASAAILYAVIEGGANHVILVPGAASGWSSSSVTGVHEAIAAAVDQHGVALLTSFSAVPPAAVACLGVGDVGAGIAWAAASGAASVFHVAWASPLRPVSLRFSTATARFTPQIVAPGGFAEPPLAPLRKHFQSCGGGGGECDPLPDALQLCSRWLRPVVQYGLCHPAGDYERGRHTTAAANSHRDASRFSGHRLLEEVSPVALPLGSVAGLAGLVADAAFARPLAPLAYNRLADRVAGWILVDTALVGEGGQAAVELVLGALGANLTVLPPGRMCVVSADAAAASSKKAQPSTSPEALAKGVAAARAALEGATTSALRVDDVPAAAIVGAIQRAGDALKAAGAITEAQLQALGRWVRVYVWALHAHTSPAAAPSGGSVNSSALVVARPELPPVTLPAVMPAAREHLNHCYADHHNVRDILLVVNFNDWNHDWAPKNVYNLLAMHGSTFPAIVVYTSKEWMPEIQENGVPSVNMFFCKGGGGNSLGLKAQMCTGLAMAAFPGHIGYLVINDDAMINPWNMLGYRIDWLWHKPPQGYEWYYDCQEKSKNHGDPEYEARAAKNMYPWGGWCYNCWSWYDSYGPLSFKKIHDIVPSWMIDIKTKNLGRSDGVACSMVDVFYVPGTMAEPFGWLAILTARTGTEVELAQATMWDMVAPRAEREFLRNVFRGGKGEAEREYNPRLHDWAHKFPFSKNDTLAIAWAGVNLSRDEGLFYRPNITALVTRPIVNDFY